MIVQQIPPITPIGVSKPSLRPRPFSAPVHFGSETTDEEVKKGLFGSKVSAWLTVLLNFIGGSAIVAASLMPQPADKSAEQSIEAALQQSPAIVESVTGKAVSEPNARVIDDFGPNIVIVADRDLTPKERTFFEAMQPIVEKTGWTLFSIAMFSSFYGWLGASFTRKQPSMALGNAVGMAAAPSFIFMEPSAALIGLMFAITGLTFTGVANIVENDKQQEGDPSKEASQREYDMQFLTQAETYRQFFSASPEGRAVRDEFRQMGRFILDDQVNTAKSVRAVVPELTRNSMALAGYFKNKGIQLVKYVSRDKLFKDHDPGTLKAIMEPNGEQTQVTGLLYYVGGTVMGFFPVAGAIITGAGSLSANLLTMAIGTNRNDAMGKSLEYLSLPKIAIDFFQHIPMMVGVNRIFRALTIDWMAAHMNNEDDNRLIDTNKKDDAK